VSEERLVAALKRRLARRGDEGDTAKANGLYATEGLSKEWLAMNQIKESDALKMQVVLKENVDKLNAVYAKCLFIPPDSEIGNQDTCIREMKKKRNPRRKFIVELYERKVVLVVNRRLTPEQNYAHFVKQLQRKGFTLRLSEKCAKKVAQLTGKPVPGVASKKISEVTKYVVTEPVKPLDSELKEITKDAVSEAKKDVEQAAEKSPSGALTVPGAAGKDGQGNANTAAEKVVQDKGPEAIAQQNEASKNGQTKT
jgi:hypothetical protein